MDVSKFKKIYVLGTTKHVAGYSLKKDHVYYMDDDTSILFKKSKGFLYEIGYCKGGLRNYTFYDEPKPECVELDDNLNIRYPKRHGYPSKKITKHATGRFLPEGFVKKEVVKEEVTKKEIGVQTEESQPFIVVGYLGV